MSCKMTDWAKIPCLKVLVGEKSFEMKGIFIENKWMEVKHFHFFSSLNSMKMKIIVRQVLLL